MGKTWRRRSAYVQDEDKLHLAHQRVADDTEISGCWRGDNGEVFFVRAYGNTVFWYAQAPDWACAHVAMGEQDRKQDEHSSPAWTVQCHDIVLSTRFRYTGKIRVSSTSKDELRVERLRGPFATDVLRRVG